MSNITHILDKFVFLIAITIATIAVPILSNTPQIVKASSCSSSASAGGNVRGMPSPDAIVRVPPSSGNGGCASTSGAIGGPNGGAGSRTIGGNPSACAATSTSPRSLGLNSGASASCSTNSSPFLAH